MSYFTDLRDGTLRGLGLATGEDAAKTISSVTSSVASPAAAPAAAAVPSTVVATVKKAAVNPMVLIGVALLALAVLGKKRRS